MKNITALALSSFATTAVILAGCASTSALDKAMEREAAQYDRDQARLSAAVSLRDNEIQGMPEWVTHKPQPDSVGLYGMGIGVSPQLSTALRISNLEARYDVARELSSELSAEETLTGGHRPGYQAIVNTFVDSVDVAGAQDIDRRIDASPEGYKVYSLIRLPYQSVSRNMSRLGGEQADAEAALVAQYDRLMARVSSEPAYTPETVNTATRDLPDSEENMPDDVLLRALQESHD